MGAHALAAAAQGDAAHAAHARFGAFAARWRPSGPARRASVARPRQRRAGRFRPHHAIGPLRSAAAGGERPRHRHDCVAEVGGLDARAHVQGETGQPHARPGARSSAERGWRAAGRFQRDDRSRRPAAVERHRQPRGRPDRHPGTLGHPGRDRARAPRRRRRRGPDTRRRIRGRRRAARAHRDGHAPAEDVRARSPRDGGRDRRRAPAPRVPARRGPAARARPAGTCRSKAASPSTRRASPTVGTSCGRSRVPSRSRRSASWRT